MPTKKVVKAKRTKKTENIVEKKLNEMVSDETAQKTEKPAPRKKASFPWWSLVSLVLLLAFVSIVLFEYNRDFRNNLISLVNSTGLVKLDKAGEKPVVAKSTINLTIVLNKSDANQTASIDQYVKNVETNLPNTEVKTTLIDKNDPAGQDIIKKLEAKYIPIFTTDESIKKHPMYAQFAQAITQKNGIMTFSSEGMEYLETPAIGDARVVGNLAKAKVVITEYASLTCHYCQEMQPIIDNVLKKYPNDVAWVYKNYDRGGIDQLLNGAAECAADQNKLEAMVTNLYNQQSDIFEAMQSGDKAEAAVYEQIKKAAKAAGANSDKVLACAKAGTYAEKISRQTAEGQQYGVIGTPGFFINQFFLGGATSEENFMKIIENEINKKK